MKAELDFTDEIDAEITAYQVPDGAIWIGIGEAQICVTASQVRRLIEALAEATKQAE